MTRRLGTLPVLRILLRTSVLRLLRGTAIARLRKSGEGRRGAPPRAGFGMLLLILVSIPLFGFTATQMAGREMRRIAQDAERISTGVEPIDLAQRVLRARDAERILFTPRDWPGPQGEERFERAVAGLAILLLFLALATGLGLANEDLGKPEWSFVNWFQFPVATSSLVLARTLAMSFLQLFCWIVCWPLYAQFLYGAGFGGWSIPLAALGAYGVSLSAAALRVALETVIRLHLRIEWVRTLQAGFSLIALCGFALLFLMGSKGLDPTRWLQDTTLLPSNLLLCTPFTWPTGLVRFGPLALLPAAAFLLALVAGCHILATRQLRHGIVRTTGGPVARLGAAARWSRPSRLSGMLGKELRLLLRDRVFLAQTLLAPTFFVLFQWLAQPAMARFDADTATDLTAVFAYGIGAYALGAGCFQVLVGERRALWLLYASPMPIDAALLAKSRLWVRIGLGFAIATLAAIALSAGGRLQPTDFASDAVFALAGVLCAGRIATAIGVLGTDLRNEGHKRRIRARFYYAYLFLAGSYATGLASDSIAIRGAVLLGMATLAAALWERVRARIPSLLDPSPVPHAEIHMLDGIVAVITMTVIAATGFVLMKFAFGVDLERVGPGGLYGLTAIASILTVLAFGVVLGRRGIPLDRFLAAPGDGRAVLPRLAFGILAGIALGALGVGYLALARRAGWLAGVTPVAGSADFVILAFAAVVAAPLCEELIFRAMLFPAMERLVRTPLAVVWSAAVFAVCHPQQAWVPVFVVGVVAALLYRHTRWLPASMATHAVYNLIVLCVA
ncbi:MAG: type II CAAX endopeptidase family protein [Planctomycetota bacterium]